MGKSKAAQQLDELPPLRKFLTVKEACEYTRRSHFWFYERMATGTLPFSWYFLAGVRVIDLSSLEAWVNSNEIKPGTPVPRRKKEEENKEAPMKR